MIYLDHNATTPVRDAAITAIVDALRSQGNASSVHRAGQQARRRLNAARDAVGSAIGLPAGGHVVFTSGGTESNHLALADIGARIIRSAIEHDSVRAARPDALVVRASDDGCIDLEALERLLRETDEPVLVSVMAANNETGIIQPVREVVALVHAAGGLVHCDAVQAIGKIPFDMAALGVDLASISAHKFGGPQGVGALAFRSGLKLVPAQRGGGQEMGLRAGTENFPGILGFAAAIGSAIAELPSYAALASRRDRLEAMLIAAEPAAVIVGRQMRRLPNTSCIALPGVAAETQVMALDLAGVCIGAGAACSSGKVRSSHVLEAMNVPPRVANSAIRISLGRTTSEGEIDRCAEIWCDFARRAMRRPAAA